MLELSGGGAAGVPVVVFAGRVDNDRAMCAGHGIREALALQAPGMSREESMRRTAELLRETARVWCLAK